MWCFWAHFRLLLGFFLELFSFYSRKSRRPHSTPSLDVTHTHSARVWVESVESWTKLVPTRNLNTVCEMSPRSLFHPRLCVFWHEWTMTLNSFLFHVIHDTLWNMQTFWPLAHINPPGSDACVVYLMLCCIKVLSVIVMCVFPAEQHCSPVTGSWRVPASALAKESSVWFKSKWPSWTGTSLLSFWC